MNQDQTPDDLKPRYLGHLLVMQSIMGSLPDEETVFDFVCRGLPDIPGVAQVWLLDASTDIDENTTVSFPIQLDQSPPKQLVLRISDHQAYRPYELYVSNFCFTLSILLEERNQRKINKAHQENLEHRVAERTRELEQEIRERIKAEEALHESEKLFRNTFASAAIGICLVHPDGAFRMVNAAFARITGYTQPELQEKRFKDFTHPDDVARSTAQINELLEGNKRTVTFEKRCIHTSGNIVWVTVNSFLFRSKDGSPQYFITHVQDITAQKRAAAEKDKLEQQLRQANKMEAIGTLAGGIAHDFNNLLAVIIGFADIAKEDIPKDNPAATSIEQVLKAAERARDLVGRILSFSRKQVEVLSPVSVQAIAEESLKLLRASIPTTIEIQADINSANGTIMANPAQVNQIIFNLCTNAAHAMEADGGILKVELYSTVLEPNDIQDGEEILPGSYVVLAVSDTGSGIAEEQLDRVFDPYFTTKEVGKGSGMGLSVVLGLVKSYHGSIRVNSVPHHGTTFTIFFPQVNLAAPEKNEPTSNLLRGSENILMVDDDTSLIEVMERSVSRLGYTVTAMTSSREALQLFQSKPHNFDLVITDQTMPHLTGVQLSKQMLQIRPDIAIIICTGYSSQLDPEKAENMGICRLLLKPFSREILASAIRTCLDG